MNKTIKNTNKIRIQKVLFITSHYKFNCLIREETSPLHKFRLLVGNEEKPCLDCVITLENRSQNSRFDSLAHTAKLNQIDALQECSLEDINDDYMSTHSFGKEMLDAIIFFINSHFPTIQSMSLNDASYIPCIRDSSDTLDLLTYSIALNKKTWYEEKINAYIKPKQRYESYRKQVDKYASKETKKALDFTDIYKLVIHASDFTKNIFDTNYNEFEKIFNESHTLPDFFKGISSKINRKEKCRFFKNWLERFINSQIMVERTWYFDLFPKTQLLEDYVINTNQNKTRKNKK
jgi:hypothetical protein